MPTKSPTGKTLNLNAKPSKLSIKSHSGVAYSEDPTRAACTSPRLLFDKRLGSRAAKFIWTLSQIRITVTMMIRITAALSIKVVIMRAMLIVTSSQTWNPKKVRFKNWFPFQEFVCCAFAYGRVCVGPPVGRALEFVA